MIKPYQWCTVQFASVDDPQVTNLDSHVSRPSSKGTESWCKEDTDVTDIDRKIQGVENVVYDATGGHETWIYGTSYDTSKRIPRGRVKPVPECLYRFNEHSEITSNWDKVRT